MVIPNNHGIHTGNGESAELTNHNVSSDGSEESEADFDLGEDKEHIEKIAYRETRYVCYLRLGLILTLAVAASIVCATVYLFVSDEENDEFEQAFVAYSTKLSETFQSIADRRLGAIAAFSTTITSFALATNDSWPFVTVPHFEAQIRHIAKLANVQSIAFAPLVSAKERKEWEDVHVPQNIFKWRAESLATNLLFDPPPNASAPVRSVPQEPYEGQPDFSKGYSRQIFDFVVVPEGLKFFISQGEGPFMPWWQTGPYQDGRNAGQTNLDLDLDPTFDNNLITILGQGKAYQSSSTFR